MTKNRTLLIVSALSAICLFAKTTVDYDHSVNFAKYHTYSWVSVVGATHTERKLETWYGGGFGAGWYHRGWWGGPGFVETNVENTPVGTLHIDVFDTQTKKVIWHASTSDRLSPKPDKNEKKLEKNVAEVFKKFPPSGK